MKGACYQSRKIVTGENDALADQPIYNRPAKFRSAIETHSKDKSLQLFINVENETFTNVFFAKNN